MSDEAQSVPADLLQDPLPESTFFYRRIFSYAVSVVILALLGYIIHRMNDAAQLRMVASYLCVLLFCVITYYMIAPSGEQVVKMFQTAKMTISGVNIRHDPRVDAKPERSNFKESEEDFAPSSRTKRTEK